MWNLKKKMIQINLQNRDRLRDEFRVAGGKDGGRNKGIVREFEVDMHTMLYLKLITNKDLLYSTWDSSQYYAVAWIEWETGREWIHVYTELSLFAAHLKLSHSCLLIGYILI